MIRRVVGWIILVPLCVALVVFALANTATVPVRFNPLSQINADAGLPLFIVLYAALILGVVLGGIATWFSQSSRRREARLLRRETDRLTHELETARRTPGLPVTVDDLVKS